MSDELIRALARQWSSSNADEDGVSYLSAQLRAGTLSEERVALAAYLGSSAAILVSGAAPPPSELLGWAKGLYRWSREARIRIALAAIGQVGIPLVQGSEQVIAAEEWLLDPGRPLPANSSPDPGEWSRALSLVTSESVGHEHRVHPHDLRSTSVAGPDPGHRHGLEPGAARTQPAYIRRGLPDPSPPHDHPVPDEVVLYAVERDLPIACGDKPFTSSLRVCELLYLAARWAERSLEPEAAAERVWTGLRAEVTPWALGLGDPRLDAIRARG